MYNAINHMLSTGYRMKFFSKNILWLFSLLLLTGCASSYLTSSHNKLDEKKQYNKIVVVAKSKSQTVRISFEQHLAQRLVASGINAVTSQALVPHSAITNNPSKTELESLRRELVSKGADGVLITSLIDKEDYVEVIPGSTRGYPYHMRGYGRYWQHYPVTYWEPDRLVSGVVYYLESALYDITMDDNNLHWVANFRVKDPGAIEKWAKKYATDLSIALVDEKNGAIQVVN